MIFDHPKGAIISPDQQYRYALWRSWAGKVIRAIAFIGLNPSTADECVDDPTIRRCLGFAASLGFNTLLMLNLFAFRATDPKDLKRKTVNPVGPENMRYLKEWTEGVPVVAAWGNLGYLAWRIHAREVCQEIGEMQCLGKTDHGFPRHPLFVLKAKTLEPFVMVKA